MVKLRVVCTKNNERGMRIEGLVPLIMLCMENSIEIVEGESFWEKNIVAKSR